MKETKLKIDVAKDGSGWSMSNDHDSREAFVYKTPDETYHGSGYIVIVPLTASERSAFDRQVVTNDGITGLKVPNVKEHHFA